MAHHFARDHARNQDAFEHDEQREGAELIEVNPRARIRDG